ncbi:MAG: DegT/DnrJ/EryC1/StrS family aminotransferase [Candidatus Diapherotrites archaeon]|nr:DegT/DnrJ/EryC1/StrS family aminotransferase [Candidatus Diapherotrites archaeon]
MIKFFDLTRQYESMKEDLDHAVSKVLQNGSFILGGEVRAFEKEFSGYCGTRHGVGAANGTQAIEIALRASGVKAGDEVITVANTAYPTVLAILACNATPVFADTQKETFLVEPGEIGKKISKKTKAIVPVHLYGQACAMDEIMEIAQKHAIPVIEDCCQSHGAEFNGKKTGSFGSAGCFSFYPTKNLGCYGDGGMIVTKDRALAEKMAMLRDLGQSKKNVHDVYGLNSRLDELQAAILRKKLLRLDKWNERRREIAKTYIGGMTNPKIQTPDQSGRRHVFHLFVAKSEKRDTLKAHFERNGVQTQIHYPIPCHLQKASAGKVKAGKLPATEWNAKRILSLPIYPELGGEEISKVIEAANSFR